MLNIYASNEISEKYMYTKEEYIDINCPPHSHFSIEVVIVKSGMLVVEINEKKYNISKNEMVLIMPFEFFRNISRFLKIKLPKIPR